MRHEEALARQMVWVLATAGFTEDEDTLVKVVEDTVASRYRVKICQWHPALEAGLSAALFYNVFDAKFAFKAFNCVLSCIENAFWLQFIFKPAFTDWSQANFNVKKFIQNVETLFNKTANFETLKAIYEPVKKLPPRARPAVMPCQRKQFSTLQSLGTCASFFTAPSRVEEMQKPSTQTPRMRLVINQQTCRAKPKRKLPGIVVPLITPR